MLWFKDLRRYFEKAGIDPERDGDFFLFRAITKTENGEKLRSQNKPLSYTGVREIILAAINSIGLDEKLYGTHRLRSGAATLSANSSIPDRIFTRHGRWSSDKSKDMYVEDNLDSLLSVTKNMCVQD